jgi:hypothetical protein
MTETRTEREIRLLQLKADGVQISGEGEEYLRAREQFREQEADDLVVAIRDAQGTYHAATDDLVAVEAQITQAIENLHDVLGDYRAAFRAWKEARSAAIALNATIEPYTPLAYRREKQLTDKLAEVRAANL